MVTEWHGIFGTCVFIAITREPDQGALHTVLGGILSPHRDSVYFFSTNGTNRKPGKIFVSYLSLVTRVTSRRSSAWVGIIIFPPMASWSKSTWGIFFAAAAT